MAHFAWNQRRAHAMAMEITAAHISWKYSRVSVIRSASTDM